MAVIVIGGQTKNVGKTTLISNIIRAFPSAGWTAVKISNHLHIPQHSEKVVEGSGWSVWQQGPTADRNDTVRFLQSGASRALLVLAHNTSLERACISLTDQFALAKNVIVESASAAEFLPHDLLFVVLDGARDDFKDSAKQQLDRADAFMVRNDDSRVSGEIDRTNKVPIFPAFPDRLDPTLISLLTLKIGSLPQAARSG